jgi:hypothetical protein
VISVLFPSRKRPAWLQRSVSSLVSLAEDSSQVEVLVACDPDDDETPAVVTPGLKVWVAPERYGYHGTHHYMNALARQASGTWLMLWCDQAEMLTSGWDAVIESQQPGVWYPDASPDFSFDITPAWPAAWTKALGHVAAYNHIDTYIQRLGEAVGRHSQLPVKIVHNRADVTADISEDDTYREGRKLLGPYGMTGPFPEEALARDSEIVSRLLHTSGG